MEISVVAFLKAMFQQEQIHSNWRDLQVKMMVMQAIASQSGKSQEDFVQASLADCWGLIPAILLTVCQRGTLNLEIIRMILGD